MEKQSFSIEDVFKIKSLNLLISSILRKYSIKENSVTLSFSSEEQKKGSIFLVNLDISIEGESPPIASLFSQNDKRCDILVIFYSYKLNKTFYALVDLKKRSFDLKETENQLINTLKKLKSKNILPESVSEKKIVLAVLTNTSSPINKKHRKKTKIIFIRNGKHLIKLFDKFLAATEE